MFQIGGFLFGQSQVSFGDGELRGEGAHGGHAVFEGGLETAHLVAHCAVGLAHGFFLEVDLA